MGSKQSKPVVSADDNRNRNNNASMDIQKKDNTESAVTIVSNNNNGNEGSTMMPKDSIHNSIVRGSGNGSGGSCPMKNKNGGYNLNWFGRSSSSKNSENNDDVDKKKNNANDNNDKTNTISYGSGGGGCPIKHGKNNNKNSNQSVQYNVYSQPIDPTNNMPSVANQLPSPMQNKSLSTDRVQSTIPKGSKGDKNTDNSPDTTWTYPSPQMFYNSLARKNKLGDTTEDDIESVVALHNNMNEKTWHKVMQWEEVLGNGGQSKLLKFMGRPSDLSPKAIVKHYVFGHPLPFDRHDWTVIREDGTEHRYVIDYYYDESRASETAESAMPALNDHEAVQSILVDVRPAVDTVHAAFGRVVTMPLARHIHSSTKFEPLPMLPTSDLKKQVLESQQVWANIQRNVEESKNKKNTSKSMILTQDDLPEDQRKKPTPEHDDSLPTISDDEAKEIALAFASMLGQCKQAHKKVDACKNDDECAKASLALTMCLAKVVCPLQQSAVEKALNDDNVDQNDQKAVDIYNATFDKALENMAICVQEKSQKAAIARQSHPHLFKEKE